MSRCRSCGEAILERARFCSSCGSPVVEAKLREARKVVTVLFCDLASSTQLAERLEPEALRRVLERYFACAREAVERHGGTIEKFIGDAVMAVFGIPSVHEDDAIRAVRAAVDLGKAVARLNTDLAAFGIELILRTGVNTGEVVSGNRVGENLVTGDAVVTAKRLEEAAPSGEILLGPWTFALVRDAVEVEALAPLALKGKGRPTPAYLLRTLHAEAPGRARSLDSPLVGRERELVQLLDAFAAAVAARQCQIVTVIGPAGIGKTRLTRELESRAEGARVLRGRCLPYGEGITYWPLMEIVREAAELSGDEPAPEVRSRIAALAAGSPDPERVATGVASALGIADGVAADELFWAVRTLLEELGRTQPLLVVIDDLQWAETAFLDLLEYLGSRSRDTPILLCCGARPELLDLRPLWATSGEGSTTIVLHALPPGESRTLMGNLLGSELTEEVRERVLAAANGNPLFVEELLRMLIDEDVLLRGDDGWTLAGDHGEFALPPTINALLSARLDRLAPEERVVIEHAAVIGEVFSWSAVAEIVPPELQADVGTHLQGLVRKELVRPAPPSPAGEDEFRFGHILVRDAAYAALPKNARAELHERVARLIESRFTGGMEMDEIGGYHLEQASRARVEFDLLDPRARELAEEAAARLAAAARRAIDRGDSSAATSLLERTLALLPAGGADRAPLLVDLADSLRIIGRLDDADVRLVEAAASARAGGLDAVARRAELDRTFLHWYTAPAEGTEALLKQANEAIALFQELGEGSYLAHAWERAATVYLIRCEIGQMQAALEQALAVPQGVAPREYGRIRISLALAAAFGPTPVEDGLALCQELIRQAEEDRTVVAMVELFAAQLEAQRGRFPEARAQAERARRSLEELGKPILVASYRLFAGQIELLAGDPAAAEPHLRAGYEKLKELGEQGNLAGLAVHLAAGLHAQGRDDEADAFLSEAASVGNPDDTEVQVLWRATRARIRAAAGSFTEAESLAREAASITERTDAPNLRADAQLALGRVFHEQGRDEDAKAAFGRALELYEAKGNLIGAETVRTVAEAPGPVSAR